MLSDKKLRPIYVEAFNKAMQDTNNIADAGLVGLRAVAEAAVKDAVGGEPFGYLVRDSHWCSEDFTREKPEEGDPDQQIIPLYTCPLASAAVPDEVIEMADRYMCIAHMYNGMKRSTAERFLYCLGYQDLPIGWESLTLPRLLAMLSASQPETKS